ncbi:hypothetical protein C8Q77DRAFT_1153198 [Trametes polyzona]|nr:hypothetical protein C8Q77DRAFT_1153198 [Trametes polyzona]
MSSNTSTIHHVEPSVVEAGLKAPNAPSTLPGAQREESHCPHCKKESQDNKAFDGWTACAKALHDRDAPIRQIWLDEADNALTFAALFSGVVTAFIVESYSSLRPDSAQGTIDVLRAISQQLNGTSVITALPEAAPFRPRVSDIMRNILFFASLICALISSSMSIFVKAWIREAALDPITRNSPRQYTFTRQYRHEALHSWKMQDIVTAISTLLQLAVALCMVGVVLFVWTLHPVLRGIVAGLLIFWLGLTVFSALCAMWFPSCPFKSPFARVVFSTNQLLVALLTCSRRRYSMQEKERAVIGQQEARLAKNALLYAFNTCWADRDIATLFPCLECLPKREAESLVLQLIGYRLGNMVQDEGIQALHRLKPDSTEHTNLRALATLGVQLAEESQPERATGQEWHLPKHENHKKHLLETVKRFVEREVDRAQVDCGSSAALQSA